MTPKLNSQAIQIRKMSNISKKLLRIDYEIPERYRNAFYLANAAFFDSTNWFLHRAYEVIFPTLRDNFRAIHSAKHYSNPIIHEKLENIVNVLDQCDSIIDVRFPVKRENGRYEIIRGFRSHYGERIASTPCLGGLRIDGNITRDHMKALSILSTMKNFCMGTGMAGAHGGIKINPKEYTQKELQNIVQLYVTELFKKGYCGHTDITHPDVNTSEQEMKWMTETLSNSLGHNVNASIVGKPLEHGGIEGFEKSLAFGALNSLEFFLEDEPLMVKTGLMTGLKDKTFIIQGLGKMGKPLAKMLVEKGAICVGVKEKEAYLYDANGIDIQALYDYRNEKGTIENFGLSKTDQPDSIFTEQCDILILAACHKSLVCYIANDVKAKIIVEASDGPVTPVAHKILTGKSKLVIPDIYACSGTNIASYFEYLRNLQQNGICEENILSFSNNVYANIFKNVSQENERKMVAGSKTKNIESVYSPLDFNFSAIDCIFSETGNDILQNLETYKLGLDIRTAAYTVAIQNIFKTVFSQGTFL